MVQIHSPHHSFQGVSSAPWSFIHAAVEKIVDSQVLSGLPSFTA